MQYVGGKSRIAKDIARVMLDSTDSRSLYVEPFIGGGSVAAQMVGNFERSLLSDAAQDLIQMWQALDGGWTPPDSVTEDQYQELKRSEPSPLRGFVGYGVTFGAKWFRGYARNSVGRNYAAASSRVLRAQMDRMGPSTRRVFVHQDYRDTLVPTGAVVYCDPPYRASTEVYYTNVGAFDSDEFWNVAESWSSRAHVFVSEYEAPLGWESVWSGTPRATLAGHKKQIGRTALEHLWVYRPADEIADAA